MADTSEKVLRKLMNIISGSVIDTARFIQQLMLKVNDEQEARALKKLCMDVEDGKANISLINIGNIPFDEVRQFAEENGYYIHSLQPLGDDYKIAMIPQGTEEYFEEFIQNYRKRESSYEEDKYNDREDRQPSYMETETKTEDFPEDVEDNEPVWQESEQTRPSSKEKTLIQKSKQSLKKRSSYNHTNKNSYIQKNSASLQSDNYINNSSDMNNGSSMIQKTMSPTQSSSYKNEPISTQKNPQPESSFLQKTVQQTNTPSQNSSLVKKTEQVVSSPEGNSFQAKTTSDSRTYEQESSYPQKSPAKTNYTLNSPASKYNRGNNAPSLAAMKEMRSGQMTSQQKRILDAKIKLQENSSQTPTKPDESHQNIFSSNYVKETTMSGVHSAKVVSFGDSLPNMTASQAEGIRTTDTSVIFNTYQTEGYAKTQDPQLYKLNYGAQNAKFSSFVRTQQALGALVFLSAEDLRNSDAGKELRKFTPALQLTKGIASFGSASILNATHFITLSDAHNNGRFVELNRFLKRNGKSGISFRDEESFLSTFSSVFGNGGGKSALAQLGINPYRMNEKEITRILSLKFGLSDAEARKIARDIFFLRDQHNLIKTLKANSRLVFQGGKMALRQGLRDNEGAVAFIDGVTTIQSLGHLAKTAYDVYSPFAKKALTPAINSYNSVKTATGKIVNNNIISPIKNKINNTPLVRNYKNQKVKIDGRINKIKNSINNSYNKKIVNPIRKKTRLIKRKFSPTRNSKKLVMKTIGKNRYKLISNRFRRLAKPFKILKKQFGVVANKFLSRIIKMFGLGAKLKKLLFLAVGAMFLVEFLLSIFMIVCMVIFSVTMGFFEYEDQPTDNPLDTITGITYLSLVEAEKDWAQALLNLGVVTDRDSTKVDDILYTKDEKEIDVYAQEKGWSYDSSTNSVVITTAPPFPGAPLEAYKSVSEIDGGVEVFFQNGNGEASYRTSNIQDILSMSPVFFQQNFSELNEQDNGSLATKLKNAWNTIETAYNNLKKSLKNKWNNFVGEDSIFRVPIVTTTDIKNSEIERAYAESLFHASRRETFELEMHIFPTSSTPIEEHDETYTGPITNCPEATNGGCYEFYNFYYLADGSLSGDNATSAGPDVMKLEDVACKDLTTDAEKENSPCWTENSLTLYDANGNATGTVEFYTWLCVGGHSGRYCGGHLILNATGEVYTMTQNQIEGINVVGKVPENNPPYGASITEESVDEEQIKNASDIFDIDMAIRHAGTPDDWIGWSQSYMEWAGNIFNQEWDEIYGIQSGASVMFSSTFSSSEIAEILTELSGVTVTANDVKGILDGTITTGFGSLTYKQVSVVAQAYSWVGNIGYDQFYHASQLTAGGYTDCSGFASRVWQGAGINIPLCTSATFYGMSSSINDSAMAPGDLLARDGHVVIYVGRAENGDYIYIESNVFPGRGKRGPGNIFCKTRSYSAFVAAGYKRLAISGY